MVEALNKNAYIVIKLAKRRHLMAVLWQRQQIDQLADVIRKACKLGIPVDVEKAVQRLNGKIKLIKSSVEYEAKIEKTTKDAFVISVVEGYYGPREKFSMAHELGHLFLHMGYLIDNEKWESVGTYTDAVHYRFGHNHQENEANEFAAAFLMPEAEFRWIASNNFHEGKYSLIPIADHFKVSSEAARNRGRWLNLFSWD
jgi:Zn-dependent peptidase ImmA (M78 family)